MSHVAGAAAVLCTRLEFSDAGGLGRVEGGVRYGEIAAAELVVEKYCLDWRLPIAHIALLVDGVRNILRAVEYILGDGGEDESKSARDSDGGKEEGSSRHDS